MGLNSGLSLNLHLFLMNGSSDDSVFLHISTCSIEPSLYHTAMSAKNSEYDQEIPQPQTADNPMAP